MILGSAHLPPPLLLDNRASSKQAAVWLAGKGLTGRGGRVLSENTQCGAKAAVHPCFSPPDKRSDVYNVQLYIDYYRGGTLCRIEPPHNCQVPACPPVRRSLAGWLGVCVCIGLAR